MQPHSKHVRVKTFIGRFRRSATNLYFLLLVSSTMSANSYTNSARFHAPQAESGIRMDNCIESAKVCDRPPASPSLHCCSADSPALSLSGSPDALRMSRLESMSSRARAPRTPPPPKNGRFHWVEVGRAAYFTVFAAVEQSKTLSHSF